MIFGSWAKPIFLIAFRMVPLLRLPRRESWWMDAEILMLRHQLLAIPVRAAAGPFAAGYKAMDSRESLKVLPRP